MFRFRRKREEEGEPQKKRTSARAGRSMLEAARVGLNSQWFRSKGFSILKEFEGKGQARRIIDDRSKERAIASVIGSLEGAAEAFAANNDQEGLEATAGLLLRAYVKMGRATLLDSYMDVCTKANMTEEEITSKILEAADSSNQIDIAVTLYSKAGVKEKLVGAGNRALNLYLEANEMDMDSRSRLFDYVVEAYRAADDGGSLARAGDKALENQMGGRRLSRGKEWVLDAQKAYEAADDRDRLAKLGDQYVNLYLKEGLETWLDKAVVVYEKAEADFASKLGKLADRVEEKGRAGMADTIRRKAGL
jgi:hypothetical protein